MLLLRFAATSLFFESILFATANLQPDALPAKSGVNIPVSLVAMFSESRCTLFAHCFGFA